MRLIPLSFGAAFIALALPAHAQRLDTRVRDVRTNAAGTSCTLNANRYVWLDESRAEAGLLHPPIEQKPGYTVELIMTFSPRTGASVRGLQIVPYRNLDASPQVGARLLFDGEDSGVKLSLEGNMDHTERSYITVPEADRAETAKRMLDARWFEFVVDEGKGQTRRYRYDGLRLRDVAEILSIIHYSCTGFRAD